MRDQLVYINHLEKVKLLVELGYELLPYPPNSPELGSVTYFCFQAWKKYLPV